MVTTSKSDVTAGDDFNPTPLADNAEVVMERRIVARSSSGDPVETAQECFRRVARNLAEAD